MEEGKTTLKKSKCSGLFKISLYFTSQFLSRPHFSHEKFVVSLEVVQLWPFLVAFQGKDLRIY